jgi:phage host-nuclease inhibitor protein Gam
MEAINLSIEAFAPIIVESEFGFLVGGDYASAPTEVLRSGSGLQCQCFIAQVSNGDCEHIRAVKEYIASAPMNMGHPMLSMADADYFLSQLGELDQTIEANAVSANEQINRINLWLELESEKVQRKKDYYILALDNWMQQNEFKTKQLVSGTLKLRSQQPEIKVNDTELVLQDTRFVRVIPEKRTVDKAALRKHCIQTGEEVLGTEIILKRPKFRYKLSGGV